VSTSAALPQRRSRVTTARVTVERSARVGGVARAYVGLGANLGDREATIRRALELLDAEPEIDVVAVSTLRETEPVGYLDQPTFLNGAAALRTELGPRALLERLLAVERELGRSRDGPRWGPRTIDLDLLVHGAEVVDEPGLRVPHPQLAERRFALEPLEELDPGLVVPGAGPVKTLLASLE
jgi:2-amino-4-hydroxy-6-hydroxymethyldihydropteridine diphosphokinase